MKKAYDIKNRNWGFVLKTLLLLFVFSLSLQMQGQTVFDNPQIKATAQLDTNKILIGQQTKLHLQIEVPKSLFVQWPMLNDTLKTNVEVVKVSNIDTLVGSKEGMLKLSQEITITSFDSGFYAIPPFYFLYGKQGDSIGDIAESNPVLLEVQNVKVNLKKEFKDIKPIIEEPWTFGEILPYILLAIGIFVLIAFGIYVYQRRKQNKPIFALPKKPKIPAHILALKKLNELKEQKLWQTGNSKEFYSALTDILREYMEDRMQFGAKEMVSEDILNELKKRNLSESLFKETQEVLRTADLVKFAKVEPLADENNRALKWGFAFVEATKPQEESSDANTASKSNVEPSKTIDQ